MLLILCLYTFFANFIILLKSNKYHYFFKITTMFSPSKKSIYNYTPIVIYALTYLVSTLKLSLPTNAVISEINVLLAETK